MQNVREVSRIRDAESNGKPAIGEKGVYHGLYDTRTTRTAIGYEANNDSLSVGREVRYDTITNAAIIS